jgi:MFS family permease
MSLGPAVGGYLARLSGAPQVFLAAAAVLLLDLALLLGFLPARLPAGAQSEDPEFQPQAPRGLLRNRPLLGCWLMTWSACFGLGMFTSFMPLHAQNRGLEVSQIGIVFFIQGLCNGASRIPFGRLSDAVARRSTLVGVGIGLYVLALLGCGLARVMGHFTLSAGLLGIGLGLAFTSVGALIAEVVPAVSRGSAMGGYNTCIYLGMMSSSLAMGAVSEIVGFALSFSLTAAFNLLFLGGFFYLMRDFNDQGGLLQNKKDIPPWQ